MAREAESLVGPLHAGVGPGPRRVCPAAGRPARAECLPAPLSPYRAPPGAVPYADYLAAEHRLGVGQGRPSRGADGAEWSDACRAAMARGERPEVARLGDAPAAETAVRAERAERVVVERRLGGGSVIDMVL